MPLLPPPTVSRLMELGTNNESCWLQALPLGNQSWLNQKPVGKKTHFTQWSSVWSSLYRVSLTPIHSYLSAGSIQGSESCFWPFLGRSGFVQLCMYNRGIVTASSWSCSWRAFENFNWYKTAAWSVTIMPILCELQCLPMCLWLIRGAFKILKQWFWNLLALGPTF